VGIHLEDGSEQRGDVIISAADGYTTIFRMLDGQFTNSQIREQYETWKTSDGLVYASVGVNQTFPDIPFAVEGNCYALKTPVLIAGKVHYQINFRIHNHEPGLTRNGKTLITAGILSDYTYWEAFLSNPAAYEAEKKCIEVSFVQALEQVFPGIGARVEMCDISTPLTFERITGNWQASIIGWKITPEQGMATLSKTLPGLSNFWMVGHWVYPGGGLPAGIITGREVIWRQCQKDKKRFTPVSEA
jgi:hypothetical protein